MLRSILIAVTLFSFGFQNHVMGQGKDSYKAGYYVTEAGDTISGFINYETDEMLADGFYFKKDLSNKQSDFIEPTEINSFRFSNARYFESLELKNTKQEINSNRLINAKRIVKGRIDLFSYINPLDSLNAYFIRNNQNGRIAHLVFPQSQVVEIDGKSYRQFDREFKKNLFYVESNEGLKYGPVREVKFSEKSIKKEVILYNQMFIEEDPVTVYKEPTYFEHHLILGYRPFINKDNIGLRVSYYFSRKSKDKLNKFTNVSGITYQNEIRNFKNPEDGASYLYSDFIRFMPFGLKYEIIEENMIIYSYLGFGVDLNFERSYNYNFGQWESNSMDRYYSLSLAPGAGTKFKLGSNYLIFEVTPYLIGLYVNVGYSF